MASAAKTAVQVVSLLASSARLPTPRRFTVPTTFPRGSIAWCRFRIRPVSSIKITVFGNSLAAGKVSGAVVLALLPLHPSRHRRILIPRVHLQTQTLRLRVILERPALIHLHRRLHRRPHRRHQTRAATVLRGNIRGLMVSATKTIKHLPRTQATRALPLARKVCQRSLSMAPLRASLLSTAAVVVVPPLGVQILALEAALAGALAIASQVITGSHAPRWTARPRTTLAASRRP